jgi:hypothetical protein
LPEQLGIAHEIGIGRFIYQLNSLGLTFCHQDLGLSLTFSLQNEGLSLTLSLFDLGPLLTLSLRFCGGGKVDRGYIFAKEAVLY